MNSFGGHHLKIAQLMKKNKIKEALSLSIQFTVYLDKIKIYIKIQI